MPPWTIEPVVAPVFLAVIVVALIVIAMLGPSFGNLSRSRRWALSVVRLLSILVLTLGLLRPGCVTVVSKPQNASLLIYVDTTKSMEHPHRATGPSRWESMKALIDSNRDRLEAIEDRGIAIQFFAFSNLSEKLPFEDSTITWPDEPVGEVTDIGSIEIARQRFINKRVIGYVLMSDGMQNAVEPEFDLQQVMRSIADSQTPFYSVPFGQASASEQFADLAIENLPDQFSMFVKNELGISATLSARGFANRTIPVQLVVQDRSGNETVVDTKQITVRKNVDQIPVEMSYVPDEPGPYRLKLRAQVQPNETATRNNELPAFLTVYDGGLRVLYLEGEYRAERKFLKRALDASPDIDLDVQVLPEYDRDNWPLDLTRFFDDPKYDVFIIGDLDSAALYHSGFQDNLKILADAVNRGKGLIMLGGYHSFGPGGYDQTPLADILPVEMNRGRQAFDEETRGEWHIERPIKLRQSSNHFLTKLGLLSNGQEAWEGLPPLSGANRFDDLKASAQILLESRSGEPMLVASNVGGRVLAFAGDSTWRWWLHGHQDAHKRFWRQIVLWLAFRDGQNNDNVRIGLAQRRYESNSQIEFELSATDANGDPVDGTVFESTLVAPDKSESPIQIFVRNNKTWGRIQRDQVETGGYYLIRATGKKSGQTIGNTEVEFIVVEQDKEKSNPAADPDLLARLASYTSSWGGRTVAPEEFANLLDELACLELETKIDVPQKWRLADTFNDALIFLLIFVALTGIEWGLRKKWGLV